MGSHRGQPSVCGSYLVLRRREEGPRQCYQKLETDLQWEELAAACRDLGRSQGTHTQPVSPAGRPSLVAVKPEGKGAC